MPDLKKLGSNIRKVRTDKKLTQEKLAEMSEVDPKSIIELEAGKRENPTLNTLEKIAKSLGITLKDLLNN